MFSFLFGRKETENTIKGYQIDEIPLLGLLNPPEQKFVEDKVRLVEYKKGDCVYRQGENPDAFYMVLSGRFRVIISSNEAEKAVTFLYRGDYFGEISLLTDKPHSVTVEAMNDSLVLKLDRGDFNELVKKAPSFSLHLSRLLGLRFRGETEREIVETKIVSTIGNRASDEETIFPVEFALRLKQESRRGVFFLDATAFGQGCLKLSGADSELKVLNLDAAEALKDSEISKFVSEAPSGIKVLQIAGNTIGGTYEKKVLSVLSYLITQAEFVVIALENELTELALKLLSQSDQVYLLTQRDESSLRKNRDILDHLKKLFGFPEARIKVVLSENHSPSKAVERTLGHPVFSVLPKREEDEKKKVPFVFREGTSSYSRTIRYVARELAGNLVGLVLGSGAAYGLAHVGVIKVLEEAAIPVDIIAGSSIGAVIGSLWAGGYSAREIEEITLGLGEKKGISKLFGPTDFAPVYRGFVKGNRVVRFMRDLLSDKTFRDLKIPLRIVATNLLTSEAVVFDEGDVVQAVRASIAIPGIFRCGHVNGNILIDGGVVDPLPVKLLADMGVRKIIAVNVLPGPQEILERKRLSDRKREIMEKKVEKAGPWARLGYAMRRTMRHHMRENIFNVLMNTIQYMGYTIASHSMRDADIVIHPILATGHWAEFFAPAQFIRVGEERTRERLAEIQKLVDGSKR